MVIKELLLAINGKIVCGNYKPNIDTFNIDCALASDLMSDVLTVRDISCKQVLLVTGLANIQTIRTAEMSELPFVLFVRGKKATEDMIELAEENDIILMETPYSMYKTVGLLWKIGMPPVY